MTNAHTGSSASSYTIPLCYGDITDCQIKTSGNCEDISGGKHKCVVTLSSETNAHLATCDSDDAYDLKVCCKSPQAEPSNFCKLYTTKDACWNNPRNINCTWSPVTNLTTGLSTTSNDDGGHCCGEEGVWMDDIIGCSYKSGALCNNPWRVDNQIKFSEVRDLNKASVDDTTNPVEYCAPITKGLSIGTWTPVSTY